jgi:hypothetical protein
VADYLRQQLIKQRTPFTLETVMSSPDKVQLLQQAQQTGYRTYLYFIATDDPDINISQVQNRVRQGGHSVPEDKIVSRYQRSTPRCVALTSVDHGVVSSRRVCSSGKRRPSTHWRVSERTSFSAMFGRLEVLQVPETGDSLILSF